MPEAKPLVKAERQACRKGQSCRADSRFVDISPASKIQVQESAESRVAASTVAKGAEYTTRAQREQDAKDVIRLLVLWMLECRLVYIEAPLS